MQLEWGGFEQMPIPLAGAERTQPIAEPPAMANRFDRAVLGQLPPLGWVVATPRRRGLWSNQSGWATATLREPIARNLC